MSDEKLDTMMAAKKSETQAKEFKEDMKGLKQRFLVRVDVEAAIRQSPVAYPPASRSVCLERRRRE